MQSAGAELKVLLTGHAATYAVLTRRQPALELGKWRQSEPAELTRDLRGLLDGGAPVHVVAEELAESGLAELPRSEEHTSELQSRGHLVCRLLLEKKNNTI